MSSAENVPRLREPGDNGPWWRSSLYYEPLWVSVAWIAGPLLLAGVALFYVVR
ncbi:MAG TPA: hypothetical protein VG963_00430 [Polyangiaceae bacterium]|nr:hypothetical protein [Polyangiaceae bacterium]